MHTSSAHPFRASALLVLALLLALGTSARAWWNDEWTARRKITLDVSSAGAGITSPIGGTAVLLRLHDGNFQFPIAKEDGSDIRLVAEDEKTLLPFHLERYDGLLNEAILWVRIPEVKPGATTTFWLYYGNAGPKATRAEDAKGTYDAETALVYHFSESNSAASDSSGKGNSSEAAGAPVQGSLIGGGVRFTEGGKPMTVAASPSLAWGEGASLTWSAWVKLNALSPRGVLWSRREDNRALVVAVENGVPVVEVGGAAGAQRAAAGAPLTAQKWQHVAVVADAGRVTLYVDGEAASSVTASLPAINAPLVIGGDTASGAVGFSGEMDEMQLAKAARPVGSLKLAALTQGTEAGTKTLVFGEDEHQESMFGGGGHFAVIVQNLTVDGWIVIVILAVMALFSWYVMWSKVSALNKLTKANVAFMKEWHHVAADLTVLDHDDTQVVQSLGGRVDKKGLRLLRTAPTYRIYHRGVEEIRQRVAEHSGAKRVLSGLSMQAIRASLDGAMARELQGLNNLIVFLTLSISGGPFLGLLGTVVGVMITFAAVAEAGDVNVNAIAPGIAAALLATVAGLAVAIPALFGYNYLLARIKVASTDMHVFIDEFVTKAAEYYGGEGSSKAARSVVGINRAAAEAGPWQGTPAGPAGELVGAGAGKGGH